MQEKNIGNESEGRGVETDFCPGIASFVTERGSKYVKDATGRFVRYKFDGSIYEPQEFTVFFNQETTGMNFQILVSPIFKTRRELMTVALFQGDEKLFDENSEIIMARNEVRDPNSVRIQILDFKLLDDEDINNSLVEEFQASLIPYVGADVFEIEGLCPNGHQFEGTATSIHLGHKIISIN